MSDAREPRLKANAGPVRPAAHMDALDDPRHDTRALDERAFMENRTIADPEISATQWSDWLQVKLPDPPPIPGYHLCWLSTTNQYDPIHNRMRLGYTPVKPEELAGWNLPPTVSNGQYAGMVGVEEMILFKIPLERYAQALHVFHHEQPHGAEVSIRTRVQANGLTTEKGNQQDPSGFDALGRKPRPAFGKQLFDIA